MPTAEEHTRQLLHRYISGAITAPEEAELERLALTDEGLREAMEGLQQLPEADHQAHVSSMLARARPTAVRRSMFTRYAAAATVLVLLGIATLLLPRYFTETEQAVAMEMQQEAPPEATAPLPKSAAPAPRRTDETLASTEKEVVTEPLPPPPIATQVEAEAGNEDLPAEMEEMVDMTEMKVAEEVRTVPTMPSVAARASALPTPPPPVRGRVTTEDGLPIVGASISRPGMPLEVTTDSSGAFTLAYDATLSEIRVRHLGFDEEEVALIDPTEPVQITLSEISTDGDDRIDRLRETITRQKLNLPPKAIDRGEARPVGGLRALRQKIENERPPDLPSEKIRVNFLVAPDGTLSDFRFRGQPDRATMDYVGKALVDSSTWEVVSGADAVRVYLKLRF